MDTNNNFISFYSESNPTLGIIVLLVILSIYLLPTYIGAIRRNEHFLSIVIINVLLGWSFLGWIAALGLSLTNNNSRAKIGRNSGLDKNNLASTSRPTEPPPAPMGKDVLK